MKDAVLKQIIKNLNKTLKYYEKKYIRLKRTPDSLLESCESFEHFIEVRFNMECYYMAEFSELEEETGGHLFSCVEIVDPDEAKRKFTKAVIRLNTEDYFEHVTDELRVKLQKVRDYIGGTKISFNSVKNRIKFKIDD